MRSISTPLTEPTGYAPIPIATLLSSATGELGPRACGLWVTAYAWGSVRTGRRWDGTDSETERIAAVATTGAGLRSAEPRHVWGAAVLAPGASVAAVERMDEPPARELRRLSGLPMAELARVFGVSRVSYSKWESGVLPRAAKNDHLVHVLAQVRGAATAIEPRSALGNWLLTPIAPGGLRPLDFLAEKRFSTFRGLVLRAKSPSRLRPVPTGFPAGRRNRDEVELERELLAPSSRSEDDDEAEARR